MHVHRSLPAAIVVLVVALALAVTGTLVLTGEHGSTARQSLSAASLPTGSGHARKAVPGGSENGHGTPAASSASGQGQATGNQAAGNQTAGNQTASRRKVRHFVGVALRSHIIGNARSFARITRLHPTMLEIYMRFGTAFPEASAARIVNYK